MCGRYGFSVDNIKKVYQRFEITNELPDYNPRYNIAPGQMNPVITKNSPKKIIRMFWGLIPYWAKDKTFAFKTINARAEEIETKPSFKRPFQSQRCLIPATGFYEWNKNANPHIPYFIKLKSKKVFAFAGLFDKWIDPVTQKELLSYTIITTTPNEIVAPIHKRMPVILKKEDEEIWIEPDFVSQERLLGLLKPYPQKDMIAYPVSTLVNNIQLDTPELIEESNKPEQQTRLF
jgi:putative SOS response-associated peptidase YedK